jgi:Dual-action HEIGH metallo-peptidase
MKNSKIFKLLTIGAITFLTSCEKNSVANDTNDTSVPKEISAKIVELGIGSAQDIQVAVRPDINGVSTKYYQIQDDILMTADQILHPEKHQDPNKTQKSTQYRTWYGIYPSRTISIIGFTGGTYGLTGNQITGLKNAVTRYNNLNLSVRFSLTFGANRGNCEIGVQNDPGLAPGSALSGFPSGGKPFANVWVGTNYKGGDINLATTIITHELGHCIGFRHTDYFDRLSCGANQRPEDAAGVGVEHIPGTPTGRDPNSTMNACVLPQTGFSNADKIAIDWWY